MDDIGKMIAFGLITMLGLYLLLNLLPYLVVGLAMVGAWQLYQQYHK